MFEQQTFFRELGSVQREDQRAVQRLAKGTARAADVINGALKRASSSEVLHARTGLLARTWTVEPDPSDPLAFWARNPTPYAAILNRGGVVSAKKTALAIPVGEAVTARGVARYGGPRDAETALGEKLFVWKSKNGNAFLAARVRGRVSPLFLLRGSVTIPARHYVEAAIEASRGAAIEEIKRALSS